jgi:hypothetical protein
MLRENVQINHAEIRRYVTDLRQLAASYQEGGNLAETKILIDEAIRDVNTGLSGDPVCRLVVWTALQQEVRRYFSNMSDPRWLDAMNHVLFRIGSRRQTALHSKKKTKRNPEL